jgi:hypothetical protein
MNDQFVASVHAAHGAIVARERTHLGGEDRGEDGHVHVRVVRVGDELEAVGQRLGLDDVRHLVLDAERVLVDLCARGWHQRAGHMGDMYLACCPTG